MKNFFLVRWLRDVSIAKKLYFTVGLMALLIVIELGTLMFAIHTLSSVRALVGAEGLWSKAQKDAAYSLQKYGRTLDEKDFQEYLNYLKVPLGDRKARLELFKAHPDWVVTRQGFIEGRFHPEDIDGTIKVLRRFNMISYIKTAIQIWTNGDLMIDDFTAIGDRLHKEVNSQERTPERINIILANLDPVNEKLTKLEDDFSFTLGAGSRWLEGLILKLLFSLVLTVEITGLTVTILVSRGISRGLNSIIGSSEKVAKGDFSAKASVYSKDEIGVLATSFNEMTGKLDQNVTALKRSEEELKISKEIAEQAVVVKSNFLANMSHEIRTPMNAVIGFTNLLETTQLDERQQEFVHAIKVSGKSLMTIINDILDYSKIESGKIVIEQIPFSIREIFESLLILLQPKSTEKKLELALYTEKSVPQIVMGDPTRLMQILLNLCDNALKYTARGGNIEVSAKAMQENEKAVTIQFSVKDTGIGIAADKQALIFERFTQANASSTRIHGGTGLGLSIVKNLVELQNGFVSVESEEGEGSTFSFVLTYPKPLAKKEAVEPVMQTQWPKEEGGGLRILLVEDNPMNQSLGVHVLRKFGFEPEIAVNGKVAVEKLQQKKFDLVLMDIQMPEMDGYQATTYIRNELKSPVPIVALTAHAMNGEREKCLGLGMDDYISKPFNPKELHEKIMSFFSKA
jgi:signal transduction histidine kinase/CheY-like chemotaxis protein